MIIITNKEIAERLNVIRELAETEDRIAKSYLKGSYGFYEHTQLASTYRQCELIFLDPEYYNIVKNQIERRLTPHVKKVQ